jgi:hypothetical protein
MLLPSASLPACSMRIKVKLTIQAEVLNGAILQQAFVVEYVVERHMCTTCNRQNANPNAWVACVQVGRRGWAGESAPGAPSSQEHCLVASAPAAAALRWSKGNTRLTCVCLLRCAVALSQVRQHVAHKRTFFFLEQLILKHGVDASCVNVKEMHEVRRGAQRGERGAGGGTESVCDTTECSKQGMTCDRSRSTCNEGSWHVNSSTCYLTSLAPSRVQGVDFYFSNRAHATKFIDFLQTMVPIRYR